MIAACKSLVLVLAVVAVAGVRGDYVPPYPVWPAQWHADVKIIDASQTFLTDNVPVDHTGHYYYDSTTSKVAFTIQDTLGHRGVQLASGSNVYTTDLPSDLCVATPTSELPAYSRLTVFNPQFLSQLSFTFINYEYRIRNGVYHLTAHWNTTGLSSAGQAFTIDYWHQLNLNSPYGLMFGGLDALTTPLIVEFENNFSATFDDVDKDTLNFVFSQPASCASVSAASPPPFRLPSFISHLLSRTRFEASTAMSPLARVKASLATPAPVDWPLQFWTVSIYTGNEFGSQDISTNITVAQQITGYFYYDWPGNREASTWTNLDTAHRSKTVIVNQKYHAINLDTGSCVIAPVDPVNGPLYYNWTQNLLFQETVWERRTHSFVKVNHFAYDALSAGFNNSFHYYQYDSGVPFRFQGPVLDFFPYGQSFNEYESFITGLAGVDVDTIFSVPTNCTAPVSAEDRATLRHHQLAHLRARLRSSPSRSPSAPSASPFGLLKRVLAAKRS